AALRLNSVRGYNRWLSDFASHAPGRLLGMAAIPMDTPEVAVAEIRFAAAQPGLAGGYIPLFPNQGDYGDPTWNPVWEAFVDTGLPIGLHVGGRRPGTPVADLYESAPRFMTGLVMSKLTMAESVSELIHGLVMQRYPDLTFIAVEGQIGWISFFEYYSDHLWEKHRFWTKSELEEPPSHYFRRQVYATFMEDPVGLRERDHIGIDNIMWASDYPHSETTWPNSKALTDEWFTPFGDEDKAKILWKNCATLYGLI
ncbi:MAG TPA: amidohydrolase family protein, partial [Acidimicrobiia bacterium]|nr:amidohydrolase family protein [Acidimicrobiia bacterium]